MQRTRGFLLLGLVVVMAFAAVTVIVGLRQPPASTPPPPPPATRHVVVAKRDLFWGAALTADMLRLEERPEKNLPNGYYADLQSLEGRFLVSNVAGNEVILESKLAQRGLEPAMRQKKRAMAVKVNNVVGVAGFIKPGNRVDVLVIFRPSREQPAVTKLILQNILVLATGTDVQRESEEKKASLVDVITLEVDPKEAEKLALASSQGELRLVLRNSDDVETLRTVGETIPSLLSSYRPPTGKTSQRQTMEVIKGGHVETLVFK